MPIELPSAFEERMRQQLGDADYAQFHAAIQDSPVISLRMNSQKPGANFPEGSPIPWCESGFYLEERPKFFKNPHIYAGSFYVQEASSMLIAQMADFSEDMHILDLCAAPGGKSTLLASRMTAGSTLVSNDLVRNRAAVLEDNLSRWGNPNVVVTSNHPKDFGALRHQFDLIVVDAPCSGEGMFRKDPKVMTHWSHKNVLNCAQRQRDILGAMVDALKPGGRLIYSTCTYNHHENEDIVQWLLNREPGVFEVYPAEFPAEWGLQPGETEGYDPSMRHTYHCYPHKVQGEGFFLACLEKTRAGREIMKSPRQERRRKHKAKTRAPRERNIRMGTRKQRELTDTWIADPDNWDIVTDDQKTFAVPEGRAKDMLDWLTRLNPIKIGVKLGEIKNGNLIPDHDLAMSEAQSEAHLKIELDEEQALRYLSRAELKLEIPMEKGWAIMTYQGRNLGWAKVLDGRINNHFPKHLRIRSDLGFA